MIKGLENMPFSKIQRCWSTCLEYKEGLLSLFIRVCIRDNNLKIRFYALIDVGITTSNGWKVQLRQYVFEISHDKSILRGISH